MAVKWLLASLPNDGHEILADYYSQGLGVKRDVALAHHYLRGAIKYNQSCRGAQLISGYYELGVGTEVDLAQSMIWHSFSCALSNCEEDIPDPRDFWGKNKLIAKSYEQGINGLPRDRAKAARFYRRVYRYDRTLESAKWLAKYCTENPKLTADAAVYTRFVVDSAKILAKEAEAKEKGTRLDLVASGDADEDEELGYD